MVGHATDLRPVLLLLLTTEKISTLSPWHATETVRATVSVKILPPLSPLSLVLVWEIILAVIRLAENSLILSLLKLTHVMGTTCAMEPQIPIAMGTSQASFSAFPRLLIPAQPFTLAAAKAFQLRSHTVLTAKILIHVICHHDSMLFIYSRLAGTP
jgi:hypothetical protein